MVDHIVGAAPARAALTTATVGMVGAGQLARMTHQAAVDLGVELVVLARDADDPAVLAGADARIGEADDPAALAALASEVDVVTLDHELVDNDALVRLERAGHAVRPAPGALRFAQDKLHARRTLGRRGYPAPAFAAVADGADVGRFADEHGWPVVLKVRDGGYDGRGVAVVDDLTEAHDVLASGGSWLVEAHVAIDRELAVLVARRPSGDAVTYPVVQTTQRDGMCRELVMPAPVPSELAARAGDLAARVVHDIGAVGITAVELFVSTGGDVLVNELALRPHNSGHATIEGSVTSQFHNHLRAVLDWPLGDPGMRTPAAAMVNVVGDGDPEQIRRRLPDALAVRDAHVHVYAKASLPGRKIGHVTASAATTTEALDAAREAARRLGSP